MAGQVRDTTQDAAADRPRAGRARGSRAGLDLDRIVAAARSLGPDEVTMQAVADRLGVDRKAVNHHVGDRENLLRMVALDTFSVNFSAVEIAARSRWEDACRTYAAGLVDSLIATGGLLNHLPLEDPLVTRFLDPTEALLATWVQAGLDIGTAQRSIVLLTAICTAFARDVLRAAQEAERPRVRILRTVLSGRDTGQYENLARISADPVDTYDQAQLDFSIDVFIRGAQALLSSAGSVADGGAGGGVDEVGGVGGEDVAGSGVAGGVRGPLGDEPGVGGVQGRESGGAERHGGAEQGAEEPGA
jgi:TetR/AcrR family transcriptional regulator, tetracycline repressor protein